MTERSFVKKADYGKIAPHYDRGRALSEHNMNLWLRLISKYSRAVEGARVLDLGCGTGKFAILMATKLKYRVNGADSSHEMLARAIEKDTKKLVTWDCQDADHLTYPDGSFDVIFMSQLLHHVNSPPTVIRRCHYILTPSGVLIIRYPSLEQVLRGIICRFFPETKDMDEARYSTAETVEKWLWDVGFKNVISEEICQQTYNSSSERLNAVRTRSVSSLAMISHDAFEKGVNNLTKYIEANPKDTSLLFDGLTLTAGYKRD